MLAKTCDGSKQGVCSLPCQKIFYLPTADFLNHKLQKVLRELTCFLHFPPKFASRQRDARETACIISWEPGALTGLRKLFEKEKFADLTGLFPFFAGAASELTVGKDFFKKRCRQHKAKAFFVKKVENLSLSVAKSTYSIEKLDH